MAGDLFKAYRANSVDGVLGPVNPHFDESAPKWVIKGKFYDRRFIRPGVSSPGMRDAQGTCCWGSTSSRNLSGPFRREFRGEKIRTSSEELIESGYVFIWCGEAAAYEVVPPARWKRTFMLRRALLRGAMARLSRTATLSLSRNHSSRIHLYRGAASCADVGNTDLWPILVQTLRSLGQASCGFGVNAIREPYVTE